MTKERDFKNTLNTLKKKWYWIVIAVVIILLIVGVSVSGENLFKKEFWQDAISKIGLSNHKTKQPQCTANTTLSCEDGSVIITQLCENGVLSNTGKICPCIRNTTITCEDRSIVTTQDCVNGTLINTGKICPCFSNSTQTCYNGSKVVTYNCVNGTLVNTGKACPSPPALPAPVVIEITAQRLQTLFQKSGYFTKLPSNAAILLTFFDGNGAMRNEKLFISGGGSIGNYAGGSYDLEFTMGDYRIPELESSSDFCAALAKIKNQQDLRVSLKNVLSIGKYVYLKSCVPF